MEKKWYEETPMEASERAVREDNPILLFVGIAAAVAVVVKVISLLLR